MKPLLFGKYCLLERVSVGGMAEVFRAKPFDSPDFRGYLALKRILPHLAEDDEFIKMFVDEAKLTVQLNHPNIVRIYELGQFQSSYYILMEFISGKDVLALQKTMRRQRNVMPVDMSMFIAREIARGLHFAHHKRDQDDNPLNIIHRDISPQNVLIDYRGRVKVIDFGIAKATVQSTRTAIGVLKGKMGYMSPEQVRGEVLDYRSDVFAIGAVLWEMLTNRRLFHGDNEFETMQRVRDAIADPPSSRNELVPPEVDAIVMGALTRDPEDRFESAAALADAIDAWLESNPYTADDLSIWMRTIYADDLDEERAKRDEFATIVTPEDVLRVQEEAMIPEVEIEPLGLTEDSAAADWSRPEVEDLPPEDLRESGIWAAAEAPDEGQDIAEFADQHTHVAAGGFDASEVVDDSAEFDTLQSQTPVLAAYPAVTAPTPAIAVGDVDSEPETQPIDPAEMRAALADYERPPAPTEPPHVQQQTVAAFKSEDTNAGLPPEAAPPRGFWVIAVVCGLLMLGGVGAAVAALFVEETPVAASSGAIQVTSSPAEGLQILIDGVAVAAASPHMASAISVGSHTVQVTHPEYAPESRQVEVAAGAVVAIEFDLEPLQEAPGVLTLRLPEERATLALYLDGERQVVEPAADPTLEVPAGKHLVEVTQDGFFPWSLVADVESRVRREEIVTLEPAQLPFEISAPKSSIRFGGESGRSSLVLAAVDPTQIHRLSVSYRGQGVSKWSGHLGLDHIAKGSIVVDFDKPTPKQLSKRVFGFLQVSTGDDWWELYVDGARTGLVTPIDARSKLPLTAGTHQLTFQRGETKHDKEITIESGETLLWREDLEFNWSP